MKKFSQLMIRIILITVIISLIFMPALISKASEDSGTSGTGGSSGRDSLGNVLQQGDDFVNTGKDITNKKPSIDNNKIQGEVNKIYNILFSFGVVLAVLVGAILGIKYMFGGIEEQAKIKETLFPYLIGCIITFGAFGIWKLVMTVLTMI